MARTPWPAIGGALLSACATVPPGHGGVLWTAGSGVQREALDEGVHTIGPTSSVELYDLRGQERNEDLVGLTADGAQVEARASVVTFHVRLTDLPEIDQAMGPDYYRTVVSPLVRSTARRALARFSTAQLDSAGIRELQSQLTALLEERLSPLHIVVDGVALRRVVPLSREAYRAVLETSMLEQRALTAPSLLNLGRRKADARRQTAAGIAASHAIVSPTLTRKSLDEAALHAWQRLLTAPSSHVIRLPDAKGSVLLEVPP